ncbi:heavy-metal-associated domain-containing protein [Cohnella hongkongensis]|uniref:Heavy-metal-associated domain-containing protein n=1 Tax=Cohnella hongkongensis TaxID=178337 RepID=A0ABV9FKF9_9BACL
MIEYRVKGLTCGNCARTLEEETRRLDYGESAKLSFASGKLKLDERVPLDRVIRYGGYRVRHLVSLTILFERGRLPARRKPPIGAAI